MTRATKSVAGARRRRDALLAYAMIMPSLLVFGTFVFYPLIRNFQLITLRTPPFPNLPKRYVGDYQGVRDAVKAGLSAMLAGTEPAVAIADAQRRATDAIGAYNESSGVA